MAKHKHGPNRRRSLSDPLTAALLPPANETAEERERRINAENEAKKISDGIDEMIRQEKNELKKARPDVSVLLLGQSESGKSTTLKQFQLLHSPSAFHAERIAWRAVIYLNLVRSIRRILDALSPEADVEDQIQDDSIDTASIVLTPEPPIPNYEFYRQRLQPLVGLEERLTRLLSSPDEDEPTHLGPQNGAWQNIPFAHVNGSGRPAPTITIPSNKQSQSLPVSPMGSESPTGSTNGKSKGKEMSVHTSTNWKKAFALGSRSKSPKSAHSGEIEGWWEDPEDPVHALNACAPAMMDLWRDPNVRRRLDEKRIRLQESAGFYLDEIPRITAKKYFPTDGSLHPGLFHKTVFNQSFPAADVLKARLKTLGVVEHSFLIPTGANKGVKWKIYDVGGARNQRHAWAPYFEDVNAIIFLAPISAFDQVLSEDPRVNRLEDSLLLWKCVISNKLLANVNIVLFLNKCDLLQAKLNAGVQLNEHMISYADRPNDYESVSKYMRNKFGAIHQSYTPNKERELYIHFTSVTDTRRTATIIADVRDIIIRSNLKGLKLV
ncbi:putative g-protein alpha subunit [Moniliophthora roreri]|nr:putative g-protein alpha subunit [Moniliophthora roreri]